MYARRGKVRGSARATAFALVVALGAATAATAIATGGEPATSAKRQVLGSANGLVYVRKTAPLPAGVGSQVHAVAKCPTGSAVAGGGAYVSGAVADAWINSSSTEPIGASDTPKKGWIAYVYNNGLPEKTIYVYAICNKGGADGLVYRRKTTPLPAGGSHQASAIAKCPRGNAVTGGGAYVSGADATSGWLNSSSPEPIGASDTPKKGWIAYASNNYGGVDRKLQVNTICQKGGAKGLVYRRKTTPLPASGSREAIALAKCPKGSAVVGGGAYVSGADANSAHINSSSPELVATSDTPKKGWIAYAYNRGPVDRTLQVNAICRK